MNHNYETHQDETGLYSARNPHSPGVFVEALTESELTIQIALAQEDLEQMVSDRPALRSQFNDLTRQLLTDYGFVNRGLGKGNYEVWGRGQIFLTVPAPIQARVTPTRIIGYAFKVWRRENGLM